MPREAVHGCHRDIAIDTTRKAKDTSALTDAVADLRCSMCRPSAPRESLFAQIFSREGRLTIA